MSSREKTKASARRTLKRFERDYAKMPPALAAYWAGSASHSYVQRMADGDFVEVDADQKDGK